MVGKLIALIVLSNTSGDLYDQREKFNEFLLRKAKEINQAATTDSSTFKEVKRNARLYALEYTGLKNTQDIPLFIYEAIQSLQTASMILSHYDESTNRDRQTFSSGLKEFLSSSSRERTSIALLSSLWDLSDASSLAQISQEQGAKRANAEALRSILQSLGQNKIVINMSEGDHITTTIKDDFEQDYFGEAILEADRSTSRRMMKGSADTSRMALVGSEWLERLDQELELALDRLQRIELYFFLSPSHEDLKRTDDTYVYVVHRGFADSVTKLRDEVLRFRRGVVERRESSPENERDEFLKNFDAALASQPLAPNIVKRVIELRIERLSQLASTLSQSGNSRLMSEIIVTELRALNEMVSKVELATGDKLELETKLKDLKNKILDLTARFHEMIEGKESSWAMLFDLRAQDLDLSFREVASQVKELFGAADRIRTEDHCFEISRQRILDQENKLRP